VCDAKQQCELKNNATKLLDMKLLCDVAVRQREIKTHRKIKIINQSIFIFIKERNKERQTELLKK